MTERFVRLKVDRIDGPWGFWRWRRAAYTVYGVGPDGTATELVHGVFRDGDEALRRAREVLAPIATDRG